MKHSFLTFAIPITAAQRVPIETALDGLGNPAGKQLRDAMRESLIVHFISGAVVPGDEDMPDYLVIEMSTDGKPEAALALFDEDSGGLRALFFDIFKLAGMRSDQPSAFLLNHEVSTGQGLMDTPGLNFAGAPGMSVGRIREEWEFARRLRDIFDNEKLRGTSTSIVDDLRGRVVQSPEFEDLRHLATPEPTDILGGQKASNTDTGILLALVARGLVKFFWPILLFAALVAAVVVVSGRDLGVISFLWRFATIGLGLSLVGAIGLVVVLLRREAAEPGDLSLPNAKVLEDVRDREDQGPVQNHLFGVSRMKPGYLRGFTLRLAFWIIGQLAARAFRPGHLGDIGTIHFARWFMIPGTDKLIFCSNYGGSWESYLEDFINKAANGLTGVWSNTFGFPPSRLLFFKGATDGDPFKRWARRQQIPTRMWYCAYPHITTSRIRINAAIRNGLASAATEDEATAFLSLFASRVRPEDDVERAEIQTLMFGGLGQHPQSVCVLMSLPANQKSAQAWLASNQDRISFGGAPDPERVDQIAIAATGFEKLGLDDRARAEFSFPFLQGMAHPGRSRALADTGEDRPERWSWGWGENAADCAYFIYMKAGGDLNAAVLDLASGLEAAGGRVVYKVVTTDLEDRKTHKTAGNFPREPFGFADGISQPRVRGMRRGGRLDENDQHLAAPGEFILGYPDNRGTKPLSPRLPATADPKNMLPVANAAHHLTDYPEFRRSGVNEDRDFGRNGTYIVVRQLAQDAQAFADYTTEIAETQQDHPGLPAGLDADQKRQYLAAKMIGRWQDGTSLVKYPTKPGTGWNNEKLDRDADNEFLLGRDDPTGEACPFGSHVRRSNPRDSFNPGSKTQLDIVNRHRILRRGRFYSDNDDGRDGTGLLFICANADIERQFEFIQQTWSMAPQFHGLENEVDPVLGRGHKMGRLTIPTPEGPIFLKGMPDFVRVVGGEYFFMPSKAALSYLAAG